MYDPVVTCPFCEQPTLASAVVNPMTACTHPVYTKEVTKTLRRGELVAVYTRIYGLVRVKQTMWGKALKSFLHPLT